MVSDSHSVALPGIVLQPNEAELQRRWQQRIRDGQFSAAVVGLGTIRVMGRSGDTPVPFPRIESLDALGQLAPDEQWAVRAAEAIVNQARAASRTVLAPQPGQPGTAGQVASLNTFDPNLEHILVASMVTGG